MSIFSRSERAFLALIFLYSFIPAVLGLLRIPELVGGPMIIPPNPRAVITPLPIVLHILCSSLFCLAGALQFLPSLRRNRPALHRRLGRVVGAAGSVSALTGLWMTVGYAFPDALQGPLLYGARVAFSLTMVAMILWAIVAIRSRQLAMHRAAMLRAYAIGQGASTQTVLLLMAMILFRTEPLGLNRDLIMVGAWLINLAVAELLIRSLFATHKSLAAISRGS